MMIKSPNKVYVEKAKNLTYKEVEQVLGRMRGKPSCRLEGKKLTPIEAIAIQLELDDALLVT